MHNISSSNSLNSCILVRHSTFQCTSPVSLSVCKLTSNRETRKAIQNPSLQTFLPAKIGDEFGPTWSTHLFQVKFIVPFEWNGRLVRFRWDSGSEAMLFDNEGNCLQGFVPKHWDSFTISKCWKPEQSENEIIFYVEMACNGLFGALGEGFSIDPPNPNLKYQLKMADIAVFEPMIFQLYTDLEVLLGITEEVPEDIRGYQSLYTANELINLIIIKEYEKARNLALNYFSEGNGAKAHKLVAMGHCHIDTAWLWTYDETRRKCGKSWVSQIELMKEYPDIVFTCSQMQQLAWVKEDYPGLFDEIKDFVTMKRFLPVGGTWVEMDGLLPDGESFIRQFFFGQKFLEKEFGIRAKEFWLPDTFGYSGQIPQILNVMGIKRFLTQKLSWNRVNKFPHHSFRWEGIDGSEVLAHFPPGDSYEMNGYPKELLKSVNNSEDKGRTNIGAYLYGLGDGGGGPTIPIIERLLRLQNVDGFPKVVFEGPDYFFSKLEEDSGKLCKWVGELYLEMHNGTYTSQAKIKRMNRKLEIILKQAEFLTTLQKLKGVNVETNQLKMIEDCWKNLLLNQFHDVIPGSCIQKVAEDAVEIYKNVQAKLKQFMQLGNLQLYNLEQFSEYTTVNDKLILFNPLPWSVKTVFTIPISNSSENNNTGQLIIQPDLPLGLVDNPKHKQFISYLMELKPSGYTKVHSILPEDIAAPVKFSKLDDCRGQFSNGLIRLVFSLKGPPKESLFHFINGTEWKVLEDIKNTNTEPGMYYMYDDNPASWDAWDCDDYHLETKQTLISYNDDDAGKIEVVCEGPLLAIYKWTTTATSSKTGTPLNIIRYTIMKADSPMLEYRVEVDWKGQNHKFLKVEFPINVLSREAAYEIQFGHIKRPTHCNTSWDMAQYETSGHKWVDLSQPDRGVSLINDSKYGYRIKENVICLSLLRSPKAPDENCDMHEHFIRYAIFPHAGSFQQAGTIKRAYEFNTDFTCYMEKEGERTVLPHHCITTSEEAVITEVVKLGHHKPNNTLLLRLYESFGATWSNVKIKMRYAAKEIVECNGMEEVTSPVNCYTIEKSEEIVKHGKENPEKITFYNFAANFRPFEIKSFLIHLSG